MNETHDKAIAEIWQLIRETQAEIKETQAEIEKLAQESKESSHRVDEKLAESSRRADAAIENFAKESKESSQRTDRKIRQLAGVFDHQWGRFIEALVRPNALKLFQERGIKIKYTFQRVTGQLNGHNMELDVVLVNDSELVIIEVKSKLGVQEVRDFLEDLTTVRAIFPQYRGYRVYGGVAGLEIVEEADKFAYRQGLFVLEVVGRGMIAIKNDVSFQPKNFE